jgi:phenylalanyl-tRNA synthetase beta chain
MRTSLIPGLLDSIRINIIHDENDLKLFEWGRVFIHVEGEKLPLERPLLAGVMTGQVHEKAWHSEGRKVDFYDIKGSVEALLKAMGGEQCRYEKGTVYPGYDKDISCTIDWDGSRIGRLGKVSRKVTAAFEIEKEDVYLFEIDIEALLEKLPDVEKFMPFAKFPAVYRDISIIVDRGLESARILDVVRHVGGELVESIHIFDVYQGKNIDPGEKAIAFSVVYRSRETTLDGDRVNRLHESIIDRLIKETGGRLKEG